MAVNEGEAVPPPNVGAAAAGSTVSTGSAVTNSGVSKGIIGTSVGNGATGTGAVALGIPRIGAPERGFGAGFDLAPKPMKVVLNWGRKYSLWVFNFGLACCAIEFIAASMARHDFIRLGVIPFAPGPRQADLMVVSGTVTDKMAPAVKRLYEQMPEPKYVISFGACANCGGPYWDSYCGDQGRRPDHPGRRVRARLPAAARSVAAGHHPPPGEDRRRGHRRKRGQGHRRTRYPRSGPR